jgi:hypothetical protein
MNILIFWRYAIMLLSLVRGFAVVLALLPASAMAAGLELVMVEQPGCTYCAQWNAEIGPAYPKSDEGRAAPLRRIQLRDDVPADLTFRSPPVFTPTFILVRDGQEIGRIEGYPGENFFWPMLDQMLQGNAP